jgi:hypothetical protein
MMETKNRRQRAAFGTIIKKNRTWHVVWHVNGKRYQRSSGSANREDAKRLLAEIQMEVRQGHYAPNASKLTLQGLRELVVTDYKANRRRSLPRVTYAFDRLFDFFGKEARAALIQPKVPDYMAWRRATRDPWPAIMASRQL